MMQKYRFTFSSIEECEINRTTVCVLCNIVCYFCFFPQICNTGPAPVVSVSVQGTHIKVPNSSQTGNYCCRFRILATVFRLSLELHNYIGTDRVVCSIWSNVVQIRLTKQSSSIIALYLTNIKNNRIELELWARKVLRRGSSHYCAATLQVLQYWSIARMRPLASGCNCGGSLFARQAPSGGG